MKDTELLPLTKRQQQIFDFILECMVANGAPPTRVEIADNFGFRSPNAAEDHFYLEQSNTSLMVRVAILRFDRIACVSPFITTIFLE